MPIIQKLTPDEKLCENNYTRTHRRCSDGKYEVALPFKSESSPIFGNSRQQALSRLCQVDRRLKGNVDLNEQYTEFTAAYLYLRLGHMRPISVSSNIPTGAFYLPNHAVIKTSSTSTKLRAMEYLLIVR